MIWKGTLRHNDKPQRTFKRKKRCKKLLHLNTIFVIDTLPLTPDIWYTLGSARKAFFIYE
jgi:hypothetical protein